MYLDPYFMILSSCPLTIFMSFIALNSDYTVELALVLLAHLMYSIFSHTSMLMMNFPAQVIGHQKMFLLTSVCCIRTYLG